MRKHFFFFVAFTVFVNDYKRIDALECYYCNNEQGYYCPEPFPLKSLFKTSVEYNEQMKNIALISSNSPTVETITSCFVRKIIRSVPVI